jgi:hypothetical protein
MAWDDNARTRLAADKSLTTSVATWLVERDDLLHTWPIPVAFTEQTTSSTSYASLVTFDIRVPDYADQCALKCIIEVKVATGATGPSASGSFRVYDADNSTDGTEVTGITGTSYADSSESSVTLSAATLANTTVTFGIKAKINDAANTMYVRNADPAEPIGGGRITFWFEAV